MNKTLIALMTTASLLAFGSAQAADTAAPADQPAAAAPAKAAKSTGKKVVKHKQVSKSSAKKATGDAS